jgi:hypothetical protein
MSKRSAKKKIKLPLLYFALALVLFMVFGLRARKVYLDSLKIFALSVGDVKVETTHIQDQNIDEVKILFRTGINESKVEKISILTFRLNVDKNEQLQIVNEKGQSIDSVIINENFSEGDEWEIPVNKITKDDQMVSIDLLAVNNSVEGYSDYNYQEIAKFYLKSDQGNVPKFEFIKDHSEMLSKSRPVTNIWNSSSY